MKKISELENNIDEYLNDDNMYGWFYLDDELQEMANMGRIPKTKYTIHIEGGEGYIPHIHLCKESGKIVVIRLKLLSNEYFREKDDKMNTLNSSERMALNKYLHSLYSTEYGITYWEHLCLQWNDFNPSHKINNIKQREIPDYTIINEPK